MAKRIFITATNTDIGKTHTTKLLLKEYASRGVSVGVIKPIETGVKGGYCPDGSELLALVKELNPRYKTMQVTDIVPLQYELPAAPFVASENSCLDIEKIDKAIQKAQSLCEILIIEGAGGLYVPIDENYMMIDLIAHFQASALLVTHCSLGCINDTLLSEKVLNDRHIPYLVAFNCRENNQTFSEVSEPYFLKTGKKVLKVNEDIDTLCDLLYNL